MGNCNSNDNTPKIKIDSWNNFYETNEFINQHINNLLWTHIDDVIYYINKFPKYTIRTFRKSDLYTKSYNSIDLNNDISENEFLSKSDFLYNRINIFIDYSNRVYKIRPDEPIIYKGFTQV